MRRRAALILLLTLGAGSLRAADGPFIWDQTAVHLAARVGQRAVTVAFPFRNRRAHAVAIVSLETSCRCVSATSPRMTYAAGAPGVIEVEMAVGNQKGSLEKTVTVTTDDPDGGSTALTLRVDIPSPP